MSSSSTSTAWSQAWSFAAARAKQSVYDPVRPVYEMMGAAERFEFRGHWLGKLELKALPAGEEWRIERLDITSDWGILAQCDLSDSLTFTFAPGGALEYHALTKPKKCVDNPTDTDISMNWSSLWNLA